MPSTTTALLELALELRRLRVNHWPDARGLTQAALARALGGEEPLSPATVASWENRSAPKLPPRERVLAYAQFFATHRSLEPKPNLIPPDGFTPEETAEYEKLRDKLLRLHGAARETDEPTVVRRSWQFDDPGPVTLICARLPEEERPPLAFPDAPNYTQLLSFGDLDAMVELFGHVRAENPEMQVTFRSAPEMRPDDLTGHVAIIGGIGWNSVTARLLSLARLPVEQREDPAVQWGEIFITKTADGEQKYLPIRLTTDPPELIEDVGLLARMPNPMNSSRTLTVCNGVHSRGVYGAVRSLTDSQLRDSNEQYIAENFPDQKFCILTRVQIIEGRALTPDFKSPGTVLYQWPTGASA
ncbi:MAG TPA: helix-turn-helix transcriptional regulator [Trebonia sp.]